MATAKEKLMKELNRLNKKELVNLSYEQITAREKEEEMGGEVVEEIQETYKELARNLGVQIGDRDIPLMTELNGRQIYALAGLMCTLNENDPNWDPIHDFAYSFMTLMVSHKRKSRQEILAALQFIGEKPMMPMEQGRLSRLKSWIGRRFGGE